MKYLVKPGMHNIALFMPIGRLLLWEGAIQRGDGPNECPAEARASRGVRGHAPQGNFENWVV